MSVVMWSRYSLDVIAAALVFFGCLVRKGDAISCFECYSLDGSVPDCEDEFAPYNQTESLYKRDCVVGYLGFEAFYCVKIKGVKSDGHSVLIRTCSVTDWGSQCGDIFFEQGDVTERLSGCLASCDYDGCNGAGRVSPYVSTVLNGHVLISLPCLTVATLLKNMFFAF